MLFHLVTLVSKLKLYLLSYHLRHSLKLIVDKHLYFFDKYSEQINALRPNLYGNNKSIIVYDFIVRIIDEYVGLTIINVPNRSELHDNYKEYDVFIKTLLCSAHINPLLLGVLYPDEVISGFNSLDKNQRLLIFTFEIDKQNIGPHTREAYPDKSGITFNEEVILREKFKDSRPVHNYTIEGMVSFTTDHLIQKPRKSTTWLINKPLEDVQYKALIAIHLLRRILSIKDIGFDNFDVINHIIDHVLGKFIDKGRYNKNATFGTMYINESIMILINKLLVLAVARLTFVSKVVMNFQVLLKQKYLKTPQFVCYLQPYLTKVQPGSSVCPALKKLTDSSKY